MSEELKMIDRRIAIVLALTLLAPLGAGTAQETIALEGASLPSTTRS